MDTPDKVNLWFGVPSALVRNTAAMSNMSASDLRVYLALASFQDFNAYKRNTPKIPTCQVSISRLAKIAGCHRVSATRSLSNLERIGAIVKMKARDRRCNRYEIVMNYSLPPEICSRGRTISAKIQKRDQKGKFMPSTATQLCSRGRTKYVAVDGPPSTSSLQHSSFNIPPPPPQGGNGHASEASARPMPPAPLSISEATIRELVRVKGRAGVLELLRKGNYPIPEFLLAEEGKS
jgi:hypothetical protein